MLDCDMACSERRRAFRLGTERIDPSVQLHAPLVALFYHPLQWVPVRLRCTSLLTGKVTAPRLQVTLIERITLRTHLKDDGIDTISLQNIELSAQFLLDGLCGHALKLAVDTLNPCTAELSLLGINDA